MGTKVKKRSGARNKNFMYTRLPKDGRGRPYPPGTPALAGLWFTMQGLCNAEHILDCLAKKKFEKSRKILKNEYQIKHFSLSIFVTSFGRRKPPPPSGMAWGANPFGVALASDRPWLRRATKVLWGITERRRGGIVAGDAWGRVGRLQRRGWAAPGASVKPSRGLVFRKCVTGRCS